MRQYACLTQQEFGSGAYDVSPVQDAHIEMIRIWRNAQMHVLRQSRPIDPQQQIDYYSRNVWTRMTLPQPPNILVGFFCNEQLIGYGGLVHIAWEHARAELSFLGSPERTHDDEVYTADFSAFLGLMKQMAFQELRLHRLFTETYDIRPRHIAILEANGFEREGVLRDHVWISGRAVNSIFHGCLNPNAE